MHECIQSVLGLIPDPAIRLGYLLDLSQAELELKFQPVVLEFLVNAEKKLLSISSLVPDLSNHRNSFDVLMGIMQRLKKAGNSGGVYEELSKKVEKYLRILESALATGQEIISEQPNSTGRPTMTEEGSRSKMSVASGACIFKEGDAADCAYLLRSGNVEISTKRDGVNITLVTLGPNQIFGELALLDGAPRSATATAISDCELTVVSKESLETQIEGLNGFMKYWLLYLGERIRDLTERVDSQ